MSTPIAIEPNRFGNWPYRPWFAMLIPLVRVGNRVLAERQAALDQALFIAPWQR